MDTLDTDTISLFHKRVYDIAGCSSKKIKVYLNGKKVPVNDFKD